MGEHHRKQDVKVQDKPESTLKLKKQMVDPCDQTCHDLWVLQASTINGEVLRHKEQQQKHRRKIQNYARRKEREERTGEREGMELINKEFDAENKDQSMC